MYSIVLSYSVVIYNIVSLPTKWQMMYTHVASSFRVLRLLTFIPRVRLILWTVIQSLEAS